MPTRKQTKELEAPAALPDEKIDFATFPKSRASNGRAPFVVYFARPQTRNIRLSAVDLVTANKLAAAKGLLLVEFVPARRSPVFQ